MSDVSLLILDVNPKVSAHSNPETTHTPLSNLGLDDQPSPPAEGPTRNGVQSVEPALTNKQLKKKARKLKKAQNVYVAPVVAPRPKGPSQLSALAGAVGHSRPISPPASMNSEVTAFSENSTSSKTKDNSVTKNDRAPDDQGAHDLAATAAARWVFRRVELGLEIQEADLEFKMKLVELMPQGVGMNSTVESAISVYKKKWQAVNATHAEPSLPDETVSHLVLFCSCVASFCFIYEF